MVVAAYFSSTGIKKLFKFNRKTDGAEYRAICEENMLEVAKGLGLGRMFTCQHHNNITIYSPSTEKMFRSKAVKL